jgi:general secretion pathway protein D
LVLSNGYRRYRLDICAPGTAGSGGFVPQGAGLIALPTDSALSLAYTSASFVANLKLLETFGKVRVLSSPRISVINNQTAVLKVVESIVYFQVSSNTSQAQTTSLTTFTTTPQSVDVGIVRMSLRSRHRCVTSASAVGDDRLVSSAIQSASATPAATFQHPDPEGPAGADA